MGEGGLKTKEKNKPNKHTCRYTTRAVNSTNIAALEGCSSRFKGVWREVKKKSGTVVWRARLKSRAGGPRRTINCGTFRSEELAARARDDALRGLVAELATSERPLVASHMRRASRFNFPRGGERGALPERPPYTAPSAPEPAGGAGGGGVGAAAAAAGGVGPGTSLSHDQQQHET